MAIPVAEPWLEARGVQVCPTATETEAGHDDAEQRDDLECRKHDLHASPGAHADVIDRRREGDRGGRDRADETIGHGNESAEKDAAVGSEGRRERGDRAGAVDKEECPAEQERDERGAVPDPQKVIRAARPGNGGTQLGVAQRATQRQGAGGGPDEEGKRRRPRFTGHHARRHEDPGADDPSDDDRRGLSRAQRSRQPVVFLLVDASRSHMRRDSASRPGPSR